MPRTVLIIAFMTVLGTMTEAAEPAITCGATLGPGGVYTLTGDLTCPEGVPGLTLLNRVTLDLGGYTLSVAGGVLLYVDEITVRNGTVADCSAAGWCLYNDLYPIVRGDEGHNNRLHDLTLERGVMLIGDGHQAARMHVGAPGFLLAGGSNGRFDRIDVRSTSSVASISLYGNGSWLTRSRVRRLVDVPSLYPWSSAVHVSGTGNVVAGVAIEGAQDGISVTNDYDDKPNVILGARSTDAAGVDARDWGGVIDVMWGGEGCEDNLWLFNTFVTADPPCLLECPRTIRARP
jgi:hypothetical protein